MLGFRGEDMRIQPLAWIAVIVSGLMFAIGAVVLVQSLWVSPARYSDFVVGAIAWPAAGKLQDLLSFPLFVFTAVATGAAAYRLMVAMQRDSIDALESFTNVFLWWCVPVWLGLALWLAKPGSEWFPLGIGAAGCCALLVGIALARRKGGVDATWLGLAVLAGLMLGLFPYGLGAIYDRLGGVSRWAYFSAIPKASLGVICTGLLTILGIASWRPSSLVRHLTKLLLIAQLGIAPFYLLLCPDIYVGDVPAYTTTLWLKVLAGGLSLAACADVIFRFLRYGCGEKHIPLRCLSPLAVFALIVLFRFGQTLPPVVSPDDYHFGESLIGWWSSAGFGKIPYLDVISPHGIFGDDFGGYISKIFFDGTAASMVEADRVASALTFLMAFLALARYTRSLGIAFISTLLLGLIARKLFFAFLIPFLCLWLVNSARLSDRRWLFLWLASAPLLILAVPPQGLIAVVASIPIVVYRLFSAKGHGLRKRDVIFALPILLILVTPTANMLWHAIQYVLENGPINQLAYGVPWSWSWGPADSAWGIPELIRMSWILAPVCAAALVVIFYRSREKREFLITVAIPVFIFVSLMTPYALGRIDPGSPSRPGLLATFSWSILLPLLLTPLLAVRGRAVLALCIAFAGGAMGLATISKGGLTDILTFNQIGPLRDGAASGLDNMGRAFVEPVHWDRLVRVNQILNAHLLPKEPYLDLTGRNAQYFYFNRPPPMAISAPYNLAPKAQQVRAVVELQKNMPRLALLEADNENFDGGGLALRNYDLYRFVMEHYDAELHDGFIFGVLKGKSVMPTPLSFTTRDLTDVNWEHGVSRGDAALIVNDAKAISYLRSGQVLLLPSGERRAITRVWAEGNAIWLEGPPLVPGSIASGRHIYVQMNAAEAKALSRELMDRAFAVGDLRKVPVAWGNSAAALEKKMLKRYDLNILEAQSNQLVQAGPDWIVAGQDPFLWVDLKGAQISGANSGLLKFDFNCLPASNSASIRVFWWGDGMPGAEPAQSMTFIADRGTVIVPLDAYPGWLTMKEIAGLRIDLETPAACQAISIKEAALYKRNRE